MPVTALQRRPATASAGSQRRRAQGDLRHRAGRLADAGAGVTLCAFVGEAVVNGFVLRTSTIERQYLDHQPVDYEYFTRQALNPLAIDAKQAAVATYVKTYLGKTGSITSARAAAATDIAATTYGVLNTSSNVGPIGCNGSAITGPNCHVGVVQHQQQSARPKGDRGAGRGRHRQWRVHGHRQAADVRLACGLR